MNFSHSPKQELKPSKGEAQRSDSEDMTSTQTEQSNSEENTPTRSEYSDQEEKADTKLEPKRKPLEEEPLSLKSELKEDVKEEIPGDEEYKNCIRYLTKEREEKIHLAKMLSNIVSGYESTLELHPLIRDYTVFPGANRVLGVFRVYGMDRMDFERGICGTKPLYLTKIKGAANELARSGSLFNASISHEGILAIYYFASEYKEHKNYNYKMGDGQNNIQFTNLITGSQRNMEVEDISLVGFYDKSLLLLTWQKPLREATVADVYKNISVRECKVIIGANVKLGAFTDVTLLNKTRVLYFNDTNKKSYKYDVDTHIVSNFDVGKKGVESFASMTGIDVGIKGIFQHSEGDMAVYTFGGDDKVPIGKCVSKRFLMNFIPSSSQPLDITKGKLRYGEFLGDGKADPTEFSFRFGYNHSVVRVCRDIFLVYHEWRQQWALLRFIVP